MTDIGTFPIHSFPAYTFPTYTWPIAETVLPIVAEPYVVCIHEEEQVVKVVTVRTFTKQVPA